MSVILTAVELFVALFVGSLVLGRLVVLVASLVASLKPSARPTCEKHIARWRSKETRRKRLLWGPLVLVAAAFLAWMSVGYVINANLESELADSNRVVISAVDQAFDKPGEKVVLLELTTPEEIHAFVECFSFEFPVEQSACACLGTMVFEFYHGSGEPKVFGFHHGQNMRRAGGWRGDIPFTPASSQRLTEWMAANGVSARLVALEERNEAARKAVVTRFAKQQAEKMNDTE